MDTFIRATIYMLTQNGKFRIRIFEGDAIDNAIDLLETTGATFIVNQRSVDCETGETVKQLGARVHYQCYDPEYDEYYYSDEEVVASVRLYRHILRDPVGALCEHAGIEG